MKVIEYECPRVAVAMSVYKNDKPDYLRLAVDSILAQVYQNCILYISVDGPICEKVEFVLNSYSKEPRVKLFYYSNNLGLAARLNCLIEEIMKGQYCYIARMDSDDISRPERILKQVQFMKENPDIGVLGTSLDEVDDFGKFLFFKSMPRFHEVLKSNIIKRCPFNHPTVMFRCSIFRDMSLRYNSSLKNTQDYYFWVLLLSKGIKFANIDEPLLDFRVSSTFYSRRGLSKAINDLNSRFYAMRLLNMYSFKNISLTFAIFLLRLSPTFIKSIAYKYFR